MCRYSNTITTFLCYNHDVITRTNVGISFFFPTFFCAITCPHCAIFLRNIWFEKNKQTKNKLLKQNLRTPQHDNRRVGAREGEVQVYHRRFGPDFLRTLGILRNSSTLLLLVLPTSPLPTTPLLLLFTLGWSSIDRKPKKIDTVYSALDLFVLTGSSRENLTLPTHPVDDTMT